MDKFNNIFSKNLKFYLYERNMTQEDLANAIGASRQSISNWVNGKQIPKIDKVKKISDALGIDKNALFEESNTILNLSGNNNSSINGTSNTVTNNHYYNNKTKYEYDIEPDSNDYIIMIVDNIRYMDFEQLKDVFEYTNYLLSKSK